MAQPGGVSSLGIQSGSAVTVQDADGNTLFDGEAPCAVSTVFFSSPDLTDGETATLTSDGEGVATATASTDGSGTSQTITPGRADGRRCQQPEVAGAGTCDRRQASPPSWARPSR